MKHMADMDEKEREQFKRFATQIAEQTRIAGNLAQHERGPMICLWVKTLNRSATNLQLEYEVDRDGFVDDAVAQGQQYLRNMLWAMEHLRGTSSKEMLDYKIISEAHLDYLRDQRGRRVVAEVFKRFFEHLSKGD